MNTGRNQGIVVGRLLPILCNGGGITKDDIGAIRIQNDETFVEMQEGSVVGFKAALGSSMTVEGGLVLTELAKPPAAASSPRPAFGGKPGGKPSGKSYGKSDAPRGDKPSYDKKPKQDYDHKSKANYAPKPQDDYKPAVAPKPASQPVEWDDAPAPKARKPKPESKGGKPAGAHPASKRFEKPRSTMDRARDDGAVAEYKPRGKPDGKPYAGKPKGKFGGKPKTGPGGAPAVGKPNSKKNKARRAAGDTGKGGGQAPRRT